MELHDLIEEFMEVLMERIGNDPGTKKTYRSKIGDFYDFILLKLKERDINYLYFLNTADKEVLLQSIEYYIRAGNVKSRATVDIYYSVIGNFYNFLFDKYGKTNDYFQTVEKKAEFKEAYERKIQELNLLESDQQEPIQAEVAKNILRECDIIIDNIDNEKLLEKKKGVYSNYISALIVKLVLFYGLKNDAIRKLKIKDYNDQLNDLVINHYRVHLPDGLAMQMKKYKKMRKEYLQKYGLESERLFFDDFNVNKELDNTKMFILLKKITGNMQAGAVAKYAIIQLLGEGVPAYIISNFTDYKGEVLDYCQERIDEDRGLFSLNEKSRILDSALRKSELFDDM